MLSKTMLSLLEAAFPGQPVDELAPTVGGYSHQTLHVTIGGERCVLKLASEPLKRAALRHEARVLALIAPLALPAPRVLACAENEEATLMVTRALPGENGIQLLGSAPEALGEVYHTLGQVVARIHAAPLAPPDPALLLAARLERMRPALAALPLDDALRAVLVQSLAHPAWPAAPRLLHGDLGLHNILWDGRRIALLDWEWASWGAPLLDLAWLAWTLRWRKLPEALWHAFLGGYGPGAAQAGDVPADSLRQLALGQIAMILVRSQPNAAAFAEWERRARWTLEQEFMSF